MSSSGELGTLLMRVIRTLSESDTGQQREEQKRQLLHQFRDSDARLDQLVVAKQRDLSGVLTRYATVSNRLHVARARIAEIKAALVNCKELLHYKRDDLKKHWLEGVKQKHILNCLEQMQELKGTSEKYESLMAEEKYVQATELMGRSIIALNGQLKSVEGLADIKIQLEKKNNKLFQSLVSHLSWQIYKEAQGEILNHFLGSKLSHFKRFGSRNRSEGSGRGLKQVGPSLNTSAVYIASQLHLSEAGLLKLYTEIERRRDKEGPVIIEPSKSGVTFEQLLEDPSRAVLNEGVAHNIIVFAECISMLDRAPQAVELIKFEQHDALQTIVRNSTKSFQGTREGPDHLAALFSAIVGQFILVADLYRMTSLALTAAEKRNRGPTVITSSLTRLDTADVWAKVQTVVRLLLTDYLDFNSKTTIHQPTSAQFSEPTSDINSFFVRRKNNIRMKKTALFRFDASNTGMSLNAASSGLYGKTDSASASPRKEASGSGELLICDPNPHNITPIYVTLMDFISVIESSLRYDPGVHCSLYDFLMDYIKDVFLGQIGTDNSDALNEASLQLDSWKNVTDMESLRDFSVTKPLLQSTITIKRTLDSMFGYMHTLPLYSDHFLNMMCKTVMQYKEICMAAYRSLVQPESEDKRIISAQWATDDKIAPILRAYPNWERVKSKKVTVADSVSSEQRNARETELFKSTLNLGVTTSISDHEILQDLHQLRSLALLHESLEWFAANIMSMVNQLQNANESKAAGHGLPKLEQNSIQTLASLAKHFEEVADLCLLIFHIEVRLHCFFYLHPIRYGLASGHFSGGPDSTDPNVEISRLTTDLLSMEETLSATLEEHKVQYIFEGVSHLVAVIAVESAVNIKRINQHGVKKMCRNIFTVQHTLTSNITGSRDSSLDMAKSFYEMLNFRPADILNSIVEKGPMFPKIQYKTALELLHRSDPNSAEAMLAKNLAKLEDIMNKIGVTV